MTSTLPIYYSKTRKAAILLHSLGVKNCDLQQFCNDSKLQASPNCKIVCKTSEKRLLLFPYKACIIRVTKKVLSWKRLVLKQWVKSNRYCLLDLWRLLFSLRILYSSIHSIATMTYQSSIFKFSQSLCFFDLP